VGLLGDFFLGKAKFGSAFMLELRQAQAGRTGDVYTFRNSSDEEVRDVCVSLLGVPEPCRLAERCLV
jgi:hypothetical protein